MSITDFLTDLLNPDLAFLPKALAIAVMSSIVCGVVGCYVVLRGMAFIGDAVAHAVFPGIAVAFVLQGSLVLGGAVAVLNFYLSFARYYVYRWFGWEYRWVSGLPLLGSLLLVPAGLSFGLTGAYRLLIAAVVLILLDTGGVFWLGVVLLREFGRRR